MIAKFFLTLLAFYSFQAFSAAKIENSEEDFDSIVYENPLQKAAYSGNLELVKKLIHAYPLNYQLNKAPRSYLWNPPLNMAIGGRHYDNPDETREAIRLKIVKELIQAGANVNLPRRPKALPLFCAVSGLDTGIELELVELLLKLGAEPNCGGGHRSEFPIYLAIEGIAKYKDCTYDVKYLNKYLQVLYLLLEYGANIDVLPKIYSDTNIIVPSYHPNLYESLGFSIVNKLRNGWLEPDKLQLAAITDVNYPIEELTIEKIFKTDAFGMTPLMWACARGNLPLVQRIFNLMNQDQYKHLITELLEMRNHKGETAISLAVKHNPVKQINNLKKAVLKITKNAPIKIVEGIISNFRFGSKLLKKHNSYNAIISLLADPYNKEICNTAGLPKVLSDLVLSYTIGS